MTTSNPLGRGKHGSGVERDRVNWQDTGCEVAPRCLDCPLPRCRYDEPGWLYRQQVRERQEALRREAGPVVAVAERHGVSERTVYRAREAA